MLGRIKRDLGLLPTIKSRTHLPSPRGRRIDVARTAREARRTAGETLRLFRKARPDKPRRLLLLVDVSGSMKAHSEATLRFAQLLSRARPKVETFCFGTRLSRVTRTLKHRLPDEALARLSDLVFDFDGGTRIGASLEAFLSVSRYAALVRGAVTLVFSDGLERGEPDAMIHAVTRLARLSHRLIWVSPLAADPRYRPLTRAMAGILPALDGLADGSDLPALERLLRTLPAIENGARGQAAPPLAAGRRKRAEALMGIVDAHHHIWRQADLPWLQGPMVPRIFGPYEPIRRDYPIEEFLADIAGSGVEKSVYVQTNWAKTGAVDEVAWVQGVADQHGWPHAVVGYADLLDDSAADTLKRQALYPLMRGIRMQLHWHDNEMYRFAAAPDLMNDRRFRKNLRLRRRPGLVVRPAGLRGPDGRRRAACRRQSRHHFRAAACRHAGGPFADGPRRLAGRHEAPGRRAEHRLQALRPRHLHPPQRPRAHQGYRAADGRAVRRGALPVRQQFPDREAVDELCRPRRRAPRGDRLAAGGRPAGDPRGTATRVYRL